MTVTADLPLSREVPRGRTRVVLDVVTRVLDLPVASELTWVGPARLDSWRSDVLPDVRASRVELGSEDSGPGRVVLLVEAPDSVVVALGDSVEHELYSGVLYDLDARPRDLDACPLLVDALVEFAATPATGLHASNAEVEELTRRAYALTEAERTLARTVLGVSLDDVVPVLSREPRPELVGDAREVRGYLGALRDAGDGVPLEWALRRATSGVAP